MERHVTTAQTRLVQLAAVALVIVGSLRLALILPERATRNDFALYYLTSELVRDGQPPYVTDLGPLYAKYGFHPAPELPHVTGAYPPLFLRLFVPITWLPPRAGFVAWVAVEIACLLVVLWLTRRLLREELPAWAWWCVCAAAVWSDTVLVHFGYSQMGLLLAALVLGGFALLRAGRPAAACWLVVSAGSLKLFPFVLLPWFIWRGADTWRGRCRLAFFAAASVAGLVVVSGVGLWREFIHDGLPALKTVAVGSLKSVTLPAWIVNLGVAMWDFSPPATVMHWLWVLAIVVALGVVVTAWLLCCRARGDVNAQFALMSVAMIAGGLYGWPHYFVLLIFPVAVLTARVAAAQCWRRWVWLAFVLLMLDSFEPPTGGFWTRHAVLRVLATATPQYGLLLVGSFLGREVWRGKS